MLKTARKFVNPLIPFLLDNSEAVNYWMVLGEPTFDYDPEPVPQETIYYNETEYKLVFNEDFNKENDLTGIQLDKNDIVLFESIFDKFSDLLVEKNLKRKDTSLNSLSSAPLIGSCFLIIMITIGIIGIMGDLMNVL